MSETQHACSNSGTKYPPTGERFIKSFPHLLNCLYDGGITKLTCIELIKGYLLNEIVEDAKDVVCLRKYKRLSPNDEEFIELINIVIDENQNIVQKYRKSTGNSRQKSFNKIRNILVTKSDKRISLQDAEEALLKLLS